MEKQTQHIDYTDFNKIQTITEGLYQMQFTYGPDQLRRKTELYENQNGNTIFEQDEIIKTKYYAGKFEKEIFKF